MKLNSPLPQPLPKECKKAANIFQSFVDGANNGLDGVIPRSVLENARGFAIFTIFKAGFLFSARAGSGVVIARLHDGSWSCPSAIGIAGLGFGGQAGAEMTDFLIVLNSHAAVRSFMAAGSLTLGGNMSLAVGPLGRNGEASGSVNSSGKMAAMFSYSKTRGLFGGISLEGSAIVERQDANAQAYRSDISVRQLLSGSVDPPEWAQYLIRTIERCTGRPGANVNWVEDPNPFGDENAARSRSSSGSPAGYAFDGIASAGSEPPKSVRKSKSKNKNAAAAFPPPSWGTRRTSGSYFASDPDLWDANADAGARNSGFDTHFDSDFVPETRAAAHPDLGTSKRASYDHDSRPQANGGGSSSAHPRSKSYGGQREDRYANGNPFAPTIEDDDVLGLSTQNTLKFAVRQELKRPLAPSEGVARAIALFDFRAVQPGDLPFSKGDVVTITEKTDTKDTWWKGKANGQEGSFPANFVEVV